MDHSVESYLQRQATQTLELLLQRYEETGKNCYIAQLIREILENRDSAEISIPQ